jgi:hypothetical protein
LTILTDADIGIIQRYNGLIEILRQQNDEKKSYLMTKKDYYVLTQHNVLISEGLYKDSDIDIGRLGNINLEIRNDVRRLNGITRKIRDVNRRINLTNNNINNIKRRFNNRINKFMSIHVPDLDIKYDIRKRKDIGEINALIDYYESIENYNLAIGNKAETLEKWTAEIHKGMNYNEMQQEVYNNFYRSKDVKLIKKYELTAVLGTVWALYPSIKFLVRVSGQGFNSVIFNPDKSTKMFDEVLGIIAGIILGPSYLSKRVITNKEMVKKYAKEIYSTDVDDINNPIVNDIITDMVAKAKEGHKVYKKYDKEEEKKFNILVDRSNVSEMKDEYENVKRRLEMEKIRRDADKEKHAMDIKKMKRKVRSGGKKRLIDNITKQKRNIKRKHNKKKISKALNKDEFLKGTYTGMLVNHTYGDRLTMEDKLKRKVHKLLCTLSTNTKDIGRLFTQTMTLMMSVTYIMSKLSDITFNHYQRHREQSQSINDICDFVKASKRIPFGKRKEEKISIKSL